MLAIYYLFTYLLETTLAFNNLTLIYNQILSRVEKKIIKHFTEKYNIVIEKSKI